jgi:signal transduction histidine kinase
MSLVGQPVFGPVCLRSLLDEVCQSDPPWEYRPEIDCSTDLHICADEGQLRVALQELIRNAQYWLNQSTKPRVERRITITVSTPSVMAIPTALDPSQQYALIHFEDTGNGIESEDVGKIFNLGFSKRPQGERPGERGVGLFMIRRIITLHKGIIRVCGQFGEGAYFTIFLPRSTFADRQHEIEQREQVSSYLEAL